MRFGGCGSNNAAYHAPRNDRRKVHPLGHSMLCPYTKIGVTHTAGARYAVPGVTIAHPSTPPKNPRSPLGLSMPSPYTKIGVTHTAGARYAVPGG
jgi:hypothetical protein